jgi:CO/xanthine dehydrogenase FAD-binding subunit
MSAVAPVPFNAERAGKHLLGKRFNEPLIEEAARLAAEETDPTSDVHASAEYRKEIAKVMVRRAVKAAFEKAKAA